MTTPLSRPRRAAVLSIGDEITLGQRLNTNSAFLADQLIELGFITDEHRTVADDRGAIAGAIRELAAGREALVITGGLGPTQDDLTREGLGDVLNPGEALVRDAEAEAALRLWFAGRSGGMPESNLVQAMRPRDTEIVKNPHGTAPGLRCSIGECAVFALPGPPNEMKPMFEDYVRPILSAGVGDVILTAAIPEFGMGESQAAELLGELMQRDRNPTVGTTASGSVVTARIRVSGERAWAEHSLQQTVEQVRSAWQPYAFADHDESLAEAVVGLLKSRGETLVTAESCTGGLLGAMLTEVAGASAVYAGGWVTYSNEMKSDCLKVSASTIEQHGAVSSAVAEAMAEGALRNSTANYALAITGIAGPEGGSAVKPVGTVWIGLAFRNGDSIRSRSRCFLFSGDRVTVRERAAKAALQLLRFHLLGVSESTPLLWSRSSHPPTPPLPTALTFHCNPPPTESASRNEI